MVVVDEISMVSSFTLAYMHMRLEELFGGGEWFGSRNMLFVGDLLQLQPVSGNPVFEKVATQSLLIKLGCATSVNPLSALIKIQTSASRNACFLHMPNCAIAIAIVTSG